MGPRRDKQQHFWLCEEFHPSSPWNFSLLPFSGCERLGIQRSPNDSPH